MHKHGLCRHAVSVCLSVRPSFTFVDHVKTNKHVFKIFSPSGSHTILVFPYQTGWRYSAISAYTPPAFDAPCRWGIGRNRDSGLIAGYRRLLDVRSAKNIYRRPCSADHTVGDAPANVYFWWPAAWTNTPKRREQKNLIVRSGISEAETTNNKRLRSTFCIEAIQTRSIARPLCDSRASCL